MASKVVKSVKGADVNFDLLKMKQQIGANPKSIDVVARERFIDKRRRRTSRKIDEMLSQQDEAKRYAEEAIKSQQQAKAEANATEAAAATVYEEAQPEVSTDGGKTNEKFNRKIKK